MLCIGAGAGSHPQGAPASRGARGEPWAGGEALTASSEPSPSAGSGYKHCWKRGQKPGCISLRRKGKKKGFVYIVICEKLFCDAVTKGCFVVYNNIVSADFSVTSWLFLLKRCQFNASLVAVPTTYFFNLWKCLCGICWI